MRQNRFGRKLSTAIFAWLAAVGICLGAQPPVILGPAVHDGSIFKCEEGKFISVGINTNDHSVFQQTSGDGRTDWQPVSPPNELGAIKVMRDRDGQFHGIWLVIRGAGKKPAVDRFIDIWHAKTSGTHQQWGDAQRIWEGYVGAICGRLTQLTSGRIILPFALWLPDKKRGAPDGCNASTVIYSDDAGKSWKQSPARLTAPCPENFNGDGVGAVEPVVLPLKDGRIWMLMRTQTGWLYESFSRDGVEWSPAQPTRFHTSTGPTELVRLPDDRIVLMWNNCELTTQFQGEGVYGGRDALHAAISSDEGKTWRGFREIYRDPTRHQSPPKRGDRGTAYPQFNRFENEKLILASGQGATLRAWITLDPEWLEENSQAEDFSSGLTNWCVFKPFGPAKNWWRDRVQGCELIAHPSLPGKKILHLGKPDEKDADGAVWNFPAGQSGTVTASIQINAGFKGAIISLADRFIDPTDDRGETMSACAVRISANNVVNGKATMSPEKFHKLEIKWSAKTLIATVKLDAVDAGQISLNGQNPNGLCYLRFRSAAQEIDRAGFFVESVAAEIAKLQ